MLEVYHLTQPETASWVTWSKSKIDSVVKITLLTENAVQNYDKSYYAMSIVMLCPSYSSLTIIQIRGAQFEW